MPKIIIGADIVPTKSNYDLFSNSDLKTLVGDELLELMHSADYSIFNLEVPLTDEETPIAKCGPALIAPTSTINGLKKINPHFFGIANNHILDQGEQGLFSTVKLLKENDIDFAGAGKNLDESQQSCIKEISGIKIGIYCCAEHEFSIATSEKSGANPFNPLQTPDLISELKNKCDYVIVLYHGGKEHYRYPSPKLQEISRKLTEKGADLVVFQHSHCVGCKEDWANGTIVYGQGNFLFDAADNEFWNTSILLSLMLEKQDGKICANLEFVPLQKQNNTVRLSDSETAKAIITGFKERSKEIKNSEVVLKKYKEFCNSLMKEYLLRIAGKKSFLFRVVNKLSQQKFGDLWLTKKYNEENLLMLLNYIECEPHRELLIEGIKSRLGI